VQLGKHSEQPGGIRLKQTLPLWLASHEHRQGEIEAAMRTRMPGFNCVGFGLKPGC